MAKTIIPVNWNDLLCYAKPAAKLAELKAELEKVEDSLCFDDLAFHDAEKRLQDTEALYLADLCDKADVEQARAALNTTKTVIEPLEARRDTLERAIALLESRMPIYRQEAQEALMAQVRPMYIKCARRLRKALEDSAVINSELQELQNQMRSINSAANLAWPELDGSYHCRLNFWKKALENYVNSFSGGE